MRTSRCIKLAGGASPYLRNVYIGHNSIHEFGGDALVVHNSDAPLVEHNSGLNLGMGKYPFIAGNFAGMWPYNSRNTLFQHNVVGTCTFQYNYLYWKAGGFYLNCISNYEGGATTANVILRYTIAQGDCRRGASGAGKHCIYNNTFYCPSRIFLDDMTGPREVRNNLFVAPGGSLTTASASYGNNAYFGGMLPPAGETGSVLGDPRLVAGGSGQSSLDVPGYRLLTELPLLGAGAVVADDGGRDFFSTPPLVPLLLGHRTSGLTKGRRCSYCFAVCFVGEPDFRCE